MRASSLSLLLVSGLFAQGAWAQECDVRLEFIGWPGGEQRSTSLTLQDFAGGPVVIDDGHISHATPRLDHYDRPAVEFQFTTEGTEIFARYTKQNIGAPVAIVFDDVLLSAPVIQEPIVGGRGIITGDFDERQAAEMADALSASACQSATGS